MRPLALKIVLFAALGVPAAAQTPDIAAPAATPAAISPVGADPAGISPVGADPAARTEPAAARNPDRIRLGLVESVEIAGAPPPAEGRRVQARFVGAQAARYGDIVVSGVLRTSPGESPGVVRGAVRWDAISTSREGAGSRRKWLDDPLRSRFSLAAPRLDAGSRLYAQGDVAALLAASRGLLERPEEKAPAEEAGPAAEPQQPRQGARQIGGGDKGQLNLTPAAPPPGREEPDPPPDVYGTTTEGCPPSVDEAAGMVRRQARITKNGTPEGECSDDGYTSLIRTSVAGCGARVEQGAAHAVQTYRRYYVSADFETRWIDAACIDHPSTRYALQEDGASCADEIQLGDLEAWPQAELVYVDGDGQRNVVESCRRKTGATARAISLVADGCSLNHDFDAGASTQYLKAVYLSDGAQIVADGCAERDSSPVYAHSVSTDCAPLVDAGSGLAYARTKIQIAIDGAAVDIAACEVEGDGVALIETAEGCETTFDHSSAEGQSYGYSRWYHELDGDGARTYVTQCEIDTDEVYVHQLSEPQGWRHDDATRQSFALRAVYIVAHGQDVVVRQASEQEGEAGVAYTFAQTETVQTVDFFYEGGYAGICNKWNETVIQDVYTRPDGTTYRHQTGTGEDVDYGDDCEVTVRPAETDPYTSVIAECGFVEGNTDDPCYGGTPDSWWDRECSQPRRDEYTRGDGHVFIGQTYTVTWCCGSRRVTQCYPG